MTKKKQLPTMFDVKRYKGGSLTPGYKGEAEDFVKYFTTFIIPLLKKHGLSDDDHILKYLRAESKKAIYDDIVADPVAAHVAEIMSENDEKYWIPFRKAGCVAKRPKDEGFEFENLPLADYRRATAWIDAISVKDGVLSIDYELIKSRCWVEPSEKNQKAFELTTAFVEGMKELGFEKRPIHDFIRLVNGAMTVYPEGIVFGSHYLIF